MDIHKEVKELKEEIIALRREFHKKPELGFDLPETTSKVAGYLRACGIEVHEHIGKSGVLGILRGNSNGKTILLRADMDALPIEEKNDLPYKSRIKGRMHACGHDGHTAMLLGAAKILAQHRDDFKGTIKFVFQPSEEQLPGGAIEMIKDGVMENPHVDGAFGIHLWTPLKAGQIGIREGAMMAAPDVFKITLTGKGGHGAYPHGAIDPIVASAQLITALQTIVSRETDPLDTMVVTVGKLCSGDAFNVIPETAELYGTVRTLNENTHKTAEEKIERIVKGISDAFRVSYSLKYDYGYPILKNDPEMVRLVKEVGEQIVGKNNIIEVQPSMGGEDMAYFLQKTKGAFCFLGASNESKGITAPHHSPYFNIDEDVLPIGTELHIRVALEFLQK